MLQGLSREGRKNPSSVAGRKILSKSSEVKGEAELQNQAIAKNCTNREELNTMTI